MSKRTCFAVVELQGMLNAVSRGVLKTGLRSQFRPGQLMKVTDTITTATSDEIADLIRDVAGEAVSLAAGISKSGPGALMAISSAVAQVVLAKRLELDTKPTMSGARGLLRATQDALIRWVEYGSTGMTIDGGPDDLTRIASDFLKSADTRKMAIAMPLSSMEVMRAGLEIFISQDIPVPQPSVDQSKRTFPLFGRRPTN